MNLTRRQQLFNIEAFVNDDEYKEIREILFRISDELEYEGWEIFGAVNLFFRGLADKFSAIDILVSEKCFDRISEILSKDFRVFVIEPEMKKTSFISLREGSEFFQGRKIGLITKSGMEINLLSGLRIEGLYGEYFSYDFRDREIDVFSINGRKIPLMQMEVQLLIYEMNEGIECEKRTKRLRVKEYLEIEGVRHIKVIKRLIENNRLSSWIEKDVNDLLEKAK